MFHPRQLTITAYDSANPLNTVSTRVVVTVQRNQNGPVFQPSSTYQMVLVESFEVGEIVLTVSAQDQDENVSDRDTIRI